MTTARKPGRDQVAALAGVAAPLALTVILIPFRASLPNTDAALALILVVVAVAAAGHRAGGVLAALSAAAWFDFFLTVPYERFTITRHADIETTALILAVGIAVTEIAVRGRRQHTAAARRAGYLDGINAAARAVAACCRAGSCSPPARGPARAWSSGWSPSAWPTRPGPHWPAPA
jgi:K+-sensing histidine kinase KdpD